ncbi:MAG: NifU family protein [Bacilli bacterium]|nr:NifU family protein [Bacilli bacterium]
MSEGGGIEFVKYEDNIVYVKFSGACIDCGMIDVTLKDGIEELLINEIPEIKEVRKID